MPNQNDKEKNAVTEVSELKAELEHARAALNNAVEEQRRLEEMVERALARGTADLTDAARAVVVAPPRQATLPERVEGVLRQGPVSPRDIAKQLVVPMADVQEVLNAMLRTGAARNVGSEADPRLVWRLGDDSSVQELYAMVHRLISDRPMTLQEVVDATGARPGRISGAVVRLQQDSRARIVNLGTPKRARWFLVPDGVHLARIKTPR